VKLRVRLLVTTLAIGAPLVVVLGWLYAVLEERAATESTSGFVLTLMQNGGREQCEAAPETWRAGAPPLPSKGAPRSESELRPAPPPPGPPLPVDTEKLGQNFGRRRGGQFFAYDEHFASRNPEAPPLDATLASALRQGQPSATRRYQEEGRSVHETLFQMPWTEGPCSIVLSRRMERFSRPAWMRWVPPISLWAPPTLIVLAGVLIAVGPVVGRIRQLTREVRASASEKYKPGLTISGRDEISELARAFEEAGAHIRGQMAVQEAREQTLRDFLANTTHDVMIPLTVLHGHLAELQATVKDRTPEEQRTVGAAMQEAHYMASLIHNLSAAAKLDAGEPAMNRDVVLLTDVVQRAVQRHLPIARQRGVALEHAVPEAPVHATGDVTLVEQAVSNLIYNAIRYNQPGGHVAVTLEANGANGFSLTVLDDGPGIADAELSRLAERHFRGNAARTREPHGQGIGLHIAYRVVTLHGWQLRLGKSGFGGLKAEILASPGREPNA
jgi:signal transduction histidine kinase